MKAMTVVMIVVILGSADGALIWRPINDPNHPTEFQACMADCQVKCMEVKLSTPEYCRLQACPPPCAKQQHDG